VAIASIEINGVVGSDDDLPIGQLVQLSNDGDGTETTHAWSVLRQPPGAADALSDPTIENPTITLNKEGTYLVQLIVDLGMPSEVRNTVILGVRQVKTRVRVPAPGESIETGVEGWAEPAANEALRALDAAVSDPGVITAVAGAAGLSVGRVVYVSGRQTVKAGLPGEEVLPSVRAAAATSVGTSEGPLGVLLGKVGGGAPANGDLVRVRVYGLQGPYAGAVVAATPLYLTDAGSVSTAPGTVSRRIGVGCGTDGVEWWAWIDGLTGSSTGAAFLGSAPYLTDGPASGLPNAVDIRERVDDLGATPLALHSVDSSGAAANVIAHVLDLVRRSTVPTPVGMGSALALSMFSSDAASLKAAGLIAAVCLDPANASFQSEVRIGGYYGGTFRWFAVGSNDGLQVDGAGSRGYKRSGGTLQIGTVDANIVELIINGTAVWQVDATGNLVAQGGVRRIEGVANPAGADHALPRQWAQVRMGPGLLVWGVGDTGTAGPVYLVNGYTAAPVAFAWDVSAPSACVIRNLRVRVNGGGNIHDDAITFTVQADGVDTLLTCTLAAGAATAQNVTDGPSFGAGQRISLAVTFGGGITQSARNVAVSADLVLE